MNRVSEVHTTNHTFLYGSITSTNKVLYEILGSIGELQTSKLKLKDRHFGYEIDYRDDEIYLYAYGNEFDEKEDTMLLEVEFHQSIDKVRSFVNSLKEACERKNIPYYSFEYGEGDGEGNDIGEWYEVKSDE